MKSQGISIIVDASPTIDLFPQIRLINNSAFPYEESVKVLMQLLNKTNAYGSKDLLLSLHRDPENDFSQAQTIVAFNITLHTLLLANTNAYDIQIHLRSAFKNTFSTQIQLLNWLQSENLDKIMPTVNAARYDMEYNTSMLGLVMLSGPSSDIMGAIYSLNTPISLLPQPIQSSIQKFICTICSDKQCPYMNPTSRWFVLDAVYETADEEYLDIKWLENTLSQC